MESLPPPHPPRNRWGWADLVAAAVAAWVAACRTAPQDAQAPAADSQSPGAAPLSQTPGRAPAPAASAAPSPLAYRKDAARHVYERNANRIFQGKLPPLLYAIGVLEVDIDRRGQVQRLRWLRAPRHAPDVTAEIERTVRAAAPYPAPARMGRVTWTDTWLWDASGRFQLDTLTEGQL